MESTEKESVTQVNIRLPSRIAGVAKKKAKENLRSLNAEIAYRLDQAYRAEAHLEAWK